MKLMFDQKKLMEAFSARASRFCGVPEGLEAFILSGRAHLEADALAESQAASQGQTASPLSFQSLVVVRTEERLEELAAQLKVLCPDHTVLTFPGWDSMPYDRVSPRKDIVGCRLKTLKTLMTLQESEKSSHLGTEAPSVSPCFVVVSAKALLQKLPPQDKIKSLSLAIQSGREIPIETLHSFLIDKGYLRVETVREPGEYAIRGGIVDLFPSGYQDPFRLDFFGDDIDSVTTFDPLSQRSLEKITSEIELMPAGEVVLSTESIRHFRESYRRLFGQGSEKDTLYKAISDGRTQAGMEHWLPLFYPTLSTLLDYVRPSSSVYFCHQSRDAFQEQWVQIEDHYEARSSLAGDANTSPPVLPRSFFLTFEEVLNKSQHSVFLTPFFEPEIGATPVLDAQSKALLGTSIKKAGIRKGEAGGRTNTQAVEVVSSSSPLEKLRSFGIGKAPFSKPTFIFCDTEGGAQKTKALLEAIDLSSHAIELDTNTVMAAFLPCSLPSPSSSHSQGTDCVGIGVFPLSHSFETPFGQFIAAQDLYGKRSAGRPRRQRRSDLFIEESSALSVGDLVVHDHHGIGRYAGLHTITVDHIPHDCLQLIYAGDDKLFLPVENLDLITRFGGEGNAAALDKLGGKSWQNRRKKVKEDLMVMAGQLIDLAAQRKLQLSESLVPDQDFYQEFVARFPYAETEQEASLAQ